MDNNFLNDLEIEMASPKNYHVTLLLNFFLGIFGVHRFYLGKTKSGLLLLLTGGGCGIWWLVDLIITLTGNTKDSLGYEVRPDTPFIKTWSNIFICTALSFIFLSLLFNPSNEKIEKLENEVKELEKKVKKLEQENKNLETKKTKNITTKVNYLNKIEWALPNQNLLVAVEIDDYDGDILKAGSYNFSVENGKIVSANDSKYDHGEVPMMVDVFVANTPNLSPTEFNLDDTSLSPYYIGSVGGLASSTFTYELKKGDYVYIIPFKDLISEPTGIFTIK